MDIYTISESTKTLTHCPVLVWYDNDDGQYFDACGIPLEVTYTVTYVGDDYGSWHTLSVQFKCGHTLEDMQKSLQHSGEI